MILWSDARSYQLTAQVARFFNGTKKRGVWVHLRVCQKKPYHFQHYFPCIVVFWDCFGQQTLK